MEFTFSRNDIFVANHLDKLGCASASPDSLHERFYTKKKRSSVNGMVPAIFTSSGESWARADRAEVENDSDAQRKAAIDRRRRMRLMFIVISLRQRWP